MEIKILYLIRILKLKKKKSLRQIKKPLILMIEKFSFIDERNIIYLEELVNNKFKLKKKVFLYLQLIMIESILYQIII